MWHALRAELAYFRPYLLGGLGLALGVGLLITVVFLVTGHGPERHVAAFLRGMFLILAPMIVGFIVQAGRSEEHRARLLLAGPCTPRQIVGAAVLLPVLLFGVGALGAALMVGAEYLITGQLALETLHLIGFIGGQLFAYVQLGLLIQEAAAAHHQRRRRAAWVCWILFALAATFLGALYVALGREVLTWNHLLGGHLVVAVAAMAATVVLYAGRTDFTR